MVSESDPFDSKLRELGFAYPLRIVVLDYPIEHWEDRQVRDLFCKIIMLKLGGYRQKHKHRRVLPVDTSDLIGANIVICYDTPAGLAPVMGFRMITASRCDLHRQKFPALTALDSSEKPVAPVVEILREARAGNHDVAYASSWTKDSILPDTHESRRFMQRLTTASLIGFMESKGIHELLACGVLKFKIDEYFQFLGMKAITEPFEQYNVFDQVVTMYRLGGLAAFSQAALQAREEFAVYWEARLEAGETTTPKPSVEAA